MRVDMSGVRAKIRKICTDRRLGSFLASEAQRGMDKYVPMRTGALARSASVQPFRVRYGMRYAKDVFYGEHRTFSKQKHPLARARWDRGYAEASGRELGKAGTEYLKRL